MFAIEMELLTGRYTATEHDDRHRAEWPPHPVRLLYALVAAAGENRTSEESSALDWLSAQSPPSIAATPASVVGGRRDVVTHFVPVNDRSSAKNAGSSAAGLVPRSRQPRTFPTIVPESPIVTFLWDEAPTHLDGVVLDRLAGQVAYIGHSSSLVRLKVVENAPEVTLSPDPNGQPFRIPAAGIVTALDMALGRYIESGIRGPLPTYYARYALAAQAPDSPPPGSFFGDLLILGAVRGPRLAIASAERVALAFRAAIMALAAEPLPESLSGHAPGGGRSEQPHVAFAALPDVGHAHAAGTLMGVAAILPRMVPSGVRDALEEALAALMHQGDGRSPTLNISRTISWSLAPTGADGSSSPVALRAQTWTHPARRWATVTPLELDRFVKGRLSDEASQVVAETIDRVGLPQPIAIQLSPTSVFSGAGHWREFRRRQGGTPRLLIHAAFEFDHEVEGPILLGAGRYRGLGLCRPILKDHR